MRIGQVSLIVFGGIVLNDLLDSVAQLIMKAGLLETGMTTVGLANFAEFFSRSTGSLTLWTGLSIYLISFFVWIAVLARIDLSIALPVGSVCYIITPLFAVIFLHEHISPIRWLGIGLIVAGIFFCAHSTRAEKQAGSP